MHEKTNHGIIDVHNCEKRLGIPAERKRKPVLLALGANISGPWGEPRSTLTRAVERLPGLGATVVKHSGFYRTKPAGYVRQPWFLNAVLTTCTNVPPATLLRRLKLLERRAGRKLTRHWGPRPLDIDILDYRGVRVRSYRKETLRTNLVLPHPGIANRGFVLVPLAAVAPEWRHPISGLSARQLLARNPRLTRGVIRA